MSDDEKVLLSAWAGMIASSASAARSELMDPNNRQALITAIFHSAIVVRDGIMGERPGRQ